jgi:hypothetical protein
VEVVSSDERSLGASDDVLLLSWSRGTLTENPDECIGTRRMSRFRRCAWNWRCGRGACHDADNRVGRTRRSLRRRFFDRFLRCGAFGVGMAAPSGLLHTRWRNGLKAVRSGTSRPRSCRKRVMAGVSESVVSEIVLAGARGHARPERGRGCSLRR